MENLEKLKEELLLKLSNKASMIEMWETLFVDEEIDALVTPVDGMKYAERIVAQFFDDMIYEKTKEKTNKIIKKLPGHNIF